jgi:uncharacterized coiled-coil protein SlyX
LLFIHVYKAWWHSIKDIRNYPKLLFSSSLFQVHFFYFFQNYTHQWYQSQIIMDTRGKSNAKFRNEVNEALARHESSFDQVKFALQAVLTKLQALRTIRNPNPNSSEINPFAPEGLSQFHTSRSLNTNGQPHPHLKLSFPRFDGIDPIGWVYKVEQYFDFHDIALAQQVQLVSFHLDGIALQCING